MKKVYSLQLTVYGFSFPEFLNRQPYAVYCLLPGFMEKNSC